MAFPERSQNFGGIVGAAVIDNDDIGAIIQHPFHHIAQRATVVVGWHHYADFHLPHFGLCRYVVRAVHN